MENDREDRWSSRVMPADELALVASQVAALTSAGLPLGSGLLATAEEMPRGRVRSTLRSMARAMEGGATVEEAVNAQHGRLPEHLRGIVLVGARTGRTTEVLSRFLAFMNVGADLRRKLWVRLAYPALSVAIAFGIFVFTLATLGSFTSVFRDFGLQLPWVTLALLSVARLLQVGWHVLVEVVVGTLVFLVFLKFFMSEKLRRSLIAGVPILGGVWRNTSLAEFCHLLALLLESGLPLAEALRLTGAGVNDSAIERASAAMAGDVEGGLTLSQAISRRPVFPLGLARVLRWAEGLQGLPESLHTTGEMFEARARAQAAFAGTVLSIIAVVSLLLTLVGVVFGLLLPMYSLLSRLM